MELFVSADDKNSSANILQLDQLVLALPSRDYYLKASSEGDLEAYHKYMTASAILLGASSETVAEEMSAVVKLEQRLASVRVPDEPTLPVWTRIINSQTTIAGIHTGGRSTRHQRHLPEANAAGVAARRAAAELDRVPAGGPGPSCATGRARVNCQLRNAVSGADGTHCGGHRSAGAAELRRVARRAVDDDAHDRRLPEGEWMGKSWPSIMSWNMLCF